MEQKLKDILQCLSCKSSLLYSKDQVVCSKCKAKYKIINEVPIFIGDFRKHKIINSASNKLLRILGGIFIYNNKKLIIIVNKLLKKYQNKIILNVGSGGISYPNSINMDIDLFENVDLVADAHHLPVQNNSVDLIISYHVLEHLAQPQAAVNEFFRVIKPGGSIFIEVPFIQRFHGYPSDYYRFTIEGIKEVNKKFKKISAGPAGGPASALNEFLINFLRLITGNNKLILVPLLIFFLPLLFCLKYVDGYLLNKKDAYTLASGVYFVGEKK